MRIIKTLFVVLSFLFSFVIFFSSVCYAEIVMYRDANGVLCFSNTTPAVDSEVEKTYEETKGSASFPKKYEPLEKQEPQEMDAKVKPNDAEVQRQKDKQAQAQFEQKIAFEKRRLDEALRHYQVDCPRFRTRSGHSYKISSRGRNAHRKFCREKYDQIAKSIRLLEKDPGYYFHTKRNDDSEHIAGYHKGQEEREEEDNQGIMINSEWDTKGNHYTPAGGSNKWKDDGTFMQKAAGGYIDTKTGRFIPEN